MMSSFRVSSNAVRMANQLLRSRTDINITNNSHSSNTTSSIRALSIAANRQPVFHNNNNITRFQSTNATTPPPAASEVDAEAQKEESAAEPTVSEAETKLTEEVADLKAKNDDLMDKYRRSIAESDNMRKRLTKQIEDAKVFGIQSFCKDLLEVADVLNKAVAGVPEEALKGEQYLRDMHQGLTLTESQLLQVFKRHGLEAENPLGQKFDPNRHEALFQIPAPDKEVNMVLDVQKVGYILQGRTIRPALVGVSKK